ncbi:hypothetical protein KFE25_000815 [Diacronema lutheri]|uniref:3-deoxy-D-manno-octulosonic-acid transferase N-terminal domain-containing protein n=1 Tax=Diacronema lutheri TaxID=2081491 RepID=A0A8J6CCF2_DIALT|nr:hypothetical protein KFE25_000815 [Diacronema lutheri]
MAAALEIWAACSRLPINLALAARWLVGKEDARSLAERRFIASRPPPAGWDGARVVWFHAASLGESASVVPLVRAVLAQGGDRRALVTTSTATARRWLEEALAAGRLDGLSAERVAVRLAPCDARAPVERFLRAWSPACGVFVESELWPALLHTCSARGIPLALVSARLSARSFAAWSWPGARAVARALLGAFALVLPQCVEQRARFAALGARLAGARTANLKWCNPGFRPPPAPVEAAFARRVLCGRPAWVAISTHDGEDELLARAHARMLARRGAGEAPQLPLLVVVPRHADDARRVARAARAYAARGLSVARHSAFERGAPTADADVHLCDSIGQVALFVRTCPLALVCGSLVDGIGGHNPLEPMRAGCATLLGPFAQNVTSTLAAVARSGAGANALEQLRSVDDLDRALELLGPERADELARRRSAACSAADTLEARVLATTLDALRAVLPPVGTEKAVGGAGARGTGARSACVSSIQVQG